MLCERPVGGGLGCSYDRPMSTPARPHSGRMSVLSPREVLVIDMASRGLTNLEVATELGVTVHAVKFHLASIYRKFGVANRTEASRVYLLADSDRRRP